jgi:nucleoside-diphosphate-sugar epimerase
LDGAHILITGATGFVGQAVLEKLLSAYPTTTVTVLVRPRGQISGEDRIKRLIRKPVFASWRESVGDEAADRELARRVNVLEGDLGDVPDLPGDLDVVVHSASTVSFDLPINEAFASNVGGPVGLYEKIHASGSDPHVVHVSTCYVAGLRKGVSEETSLEHEVDWRVELGSARASLDRAEQDSRDPRRLAAFLSTATAEHGRAGAQAVSEAAEEARNAFVRESLVDAGRNRARTLGWPDVYTFTKALGERVAETSWGAEHRLSVVRPTIIESAFRHPYPGWIDGFKVADPLIAAYGRGMLPEFPAVADSILDVIPVDFVVNAILAAAATPPEPSAPNYYQVGSGLTNPLRFGRLYELVREYFEANPLSDAEGAVVKVPRWTFPHGPAVERSITRRERLVTSADRVLRRLPASDRTRPAHAAEVHGPLPAVHADRGHLRRPQHARPARRPAGGPQGRARLRRRRDRLAGLPPGRAHPERPGAAARAPLLVVGRAAGLGRRAAEARGRRRRLRPPAHDRPVHAGRAPAVGGAPGRRAPLARGLGRRRRERPHLSHGRPA